MSAPTQLSISAKQVFAAILKQLGNADNLKIDVNNYDSRTGGFMPLTVEVLERNIATPWGEGYEVSLCHYYESHGDLVQDPEMTFLVVDNRGEVEGNFDLLGVWPTSFYNPAIRGRNEISMSNESGQWRYSARAQKDHAAFATIWLRNLRHQQNLKPVPKAK